MTTQTQKHRHAFRIAFLCMLLLALAAPAAVAEEQTQSPAQAARFNQIAHETAELRELELLEEINEVFLTRDELRVQLEEELLTDYPPEQATVDEQVLAAFGLIPEGTDLTQLLLDLYGEQIAGYYDPRTKDMVVISGGGGLTPSEEITYAHEVVHVLQDQHFDLEQMLLLRVEIDDDAALALTALIEGDAVLVQTEYLIGRPGLLLRLVGEMVTGGFDMDQLDHAPLIVSETLLFPYEDGLEFVTYLRDQGGWEAVNAAFDDPPATTSQVLHPEKYLAGEVPEPVTLPDLSSVLGPSWELLDENVLGELQTRVLLQTHGTNATAAATAAAGWNGDRYVAWADGDETVLAWRSVWESNEDATLFAAALREADETRFGATYTQHGDPSGDGGGTLILTLADQTALIVLEANQVTYVLAPTQSLAEDLMTELLGS